MDDAEDGGRVKQAPAILAPSPKAREADFLYEPAGWCE